MSRASIAKTAFNAGEFSPRLLGRIDYEKYYQGVARMKNWLPLPFGGAERTPGTIFVSEVRDSAKEARLFDWVFGTQQAYVLVFNDSKVRFFKDRGTVYGDNPITITAITNANPGVVTAASHGLANGAHVILNGIDGMTEVNGVEYIVANVTLNTFELTDKDTGLNVNTTSYGVFIAASFTKLLMHMDEDDDFNDVSPSPHTETEHGGLAVSTVQSKFGGASGLFDGSDDYVTFADSADWNLANGNFTIDFWVRFSTTGTMVFINQNDGGSERGWYIGTASSTLVFGYTTTGSGLFTSLAAAWAPSIDTWYHVAVVRNGTGILFFIDGTQIGGTQTIGTDTIFNSSALLNVGRDGGGGSYFNGYLDEMRLTKGFARWTANFTPPMVESPIGDGTTVQGVYEISQPYAEDDLFDIQTAQAADIMYLAHGDVPPQKLSRFGDDDWTLAPIVFQDGPYLDENDTSTTLDPSGNSGSVTVTASAITGINDDEGFKTTDVGRLIRFHDGTNWCWLTITAWTSTTVVTATVTGANHIVGGSLLGNTATARWALGAWSATTGYPRSVAFFQGGLWWGGTNYQKQHLWRSVVFEYENMDPGTADDADAITVQINSNQVNIIRWLAAGKRLVVGTEGENFTVYSGVSTEPITPANVRSDPETNFGSSGITPIKIGSYLEYVQEDEKTLREFFFDFTIDAFRSTNKSILSDHITSGKIKQMAYQKSPNGILYCVLDDGGLATFTREIEQEVNAWADQSLEDTRPNDSFASVACVPAAGYTEAWFIASRKIGSSTKKYIEYQVNPNQNSDENQEDMVLLQSALRYDGSPATIITGLEHLAGESVRAYADGIDKGLFTVSVSGTVTLLVAASVVNIGLPVKAQIKLLPLEGGSTIGQSQGMNRKISEIMARVFRSLGLQIGTDGGNMETAIKTGLGVAHTALQTGDFVVPSTLGWETRGQVLFECNNAYPCTLLLTELFEYTAEEQAGK